MNVTPDRTVPRKVAASLLGVSALAALWAISQSNYLLFHTLAEFFSIAVAVATFMLAWNARRFLDAGYLLFVGIAYLYVGGLDLVHTLAYQGMGVFHGTGSNAATQLWIGSRYMESISLLVAPVFLTRQLRHPYAVLASYAVIAAMILGSIFAPTGIVPAWLRFPTCYVQNQGLTAFKITSEYVICGILLASLTVLVWTRRRLDSRVVRLMAAAIILTVFSEMWFTRYVGVYGFANMVGHMLKVLSFFAIYWALVVTGMSKPYELVFRELKQSQDALRKAKGELEKRVQDRTKDLAQTVETLEEEIRARMKLETEVLRAGEFERKRIGQDLHDSIGQMLGGIACLGQVLSRKLAARDIKEAEDAARIESIALDSLKLARLLARGLSPLADHPDSLMIALRELAVYAESMFSVSCALNCDEPVPIRNHLVATHVYRIAQEAVTNAVRHGRAKHIGIELSAADDRILVTVIDDGVGISEGASDGPGLGLRTMGYRAQSIGASLEIGRRPEGGTIVRCRVPAEQLR